MDEYVFRFDIPMHDMVLLEDSKCIEKLMKYLKGLLLLKEAMLDNIFVKCSALAVLVDKVAIIFCLQQFFEFDDVRPLPD